jgi:hypothetical protein
MSATAFDSSIQDSFNGPLSQTFADQIKALKNASGISYDDVGQAAALSGSFVGNLVRRYAYNGKMTAIRTQHVGRLLKAVKALEAQHGIVPVNAIAATSGLTIADAKQALAVAYGVSPQSIEIVIRG